MRDFFIYTILCLFCFAPAAAQEVPFEGLHLDDLISIPGERKPGIINHPVSAFELPGFKLLPSGHVHLLRHYPGISLPDMTPVSFPEKNNLRSYSFCQPFETVDNKGEYFSSGILPVETYSSTAVRSDVEARYRLTNKFSLYMSTNYLSDRYRTPRSLYTRGTSAGVAYQLSDRFLLKAGASYQYNTVLRKWEWIYMTGLVFCF